MALREQSPQHAGLPAYGEVLGGNYQVLGPLEEGGMGSLFFAQHVRLGRRVVVKVLTSRFSKDPDAIARFQREAEVVSQLHHPNIVQVLDFGNSVKGVPYLVLEYLEGESLADRLDRERCLDLERAVAITWQVASALATAHERGIVHRDLKPANVYLVHARGHPEFVKVLDFGISKQEGKSRKITGALEVVGTPSYMAPEQARAGPVDPRADQFALACMVYCMLVGEPPFAGDDVADTLQNILTRPTPLAGARLPGLPKAVDATLARALDKDPGRRFAKIGDFAWELSEASGAGRLAIAFSTAPPPNIRMVEGSGREPTVASDARAGSGFIRTPPKATGAQDSMDGLIAGARAALEMGDRAACGALAEELARQLDRGQGSARQAAEVAHVFELLLGGGARVVEPVGSALVAGLTPKLAFVLSRIDGATTIHELLDAGHLPEHQMLHAVHVLVKHGHLRLR